MNELQLPPIDYGAIAPMLVLFGVHPATVVLAAVLTYETAPIARAPRLSRVLDMLLQKEMAIDPSILGNMTKAQADSMLNATRNAFAQHANKEGGSDYNLDGGFGGPVPLVGKALGNATFYVSNNTRNANFVEPVVLNGDFRSTSLLTVKSTPTHDITLTLNGLWKREIGVSPIRPASGDEPNVSGRGGFILSNHLNWIYEDSRITGYNSQYL